MALVLGWIACSTAARSWTSTKLELGWQGVGQQITGAAVDGLLCYNVLPLFCKRLNGIGDRGGARGDSQTGNATLQCGNALFKNTLGGIGQAAIDVACISQTKAICCVLTVMKQVVKWTAEGTVKVVFLSVP